MKREKPQNNLPEAFLFRIQSCQRRTKKICEGKSMNKVLVADKKEMVKGFPSKTTILTINLTALSLSLSFALKLFSLSTKQYYSISKCVHRSLCRHLKTKRVFIRQRLIDLR